jgi:hypothetical protein
LGAAGLLRLKEECEGLSLCRQGVLCLSISAGSTPLGTASSSSSFSSSFLRSFFLLSALSSVAAGGLGFGFCEIRFTRVFRFLL